MLLIFTLLPFLLVDIGAEGVSGRKPFSPASITLLSKVEGMRAVFEQVHEEIIKDLEWKVRLAQRALEESPSLQDAYTDQKRKELHLVGTGRFEKGEDWKKNLRDSLTRLLTAHEKEIPSGSRYGCDGYVIKLQERSGSFKYVCIYKWGRQL